MAIQSFSSGQTLTAQQMNDLQKNDYNQTVSAKTTSYVLVAGDVGTHVQMTASTATTITIGTAIFAAGDSIRVSSQGAGVCTLTAGSGFTLTSSGSLALSQYSGGEIRFQSSTAATFFASAVSGLTLVKTQTIGTAVSSVEVTGAFNSTYDNYKIIISGGTASAGDNCNLTLGATATGYYQAAIILSYAASVTYSGTANGTSFVGAVMQNTNVLYANWDLLGPNLAKETNFVCTYGYTSTTAGGQWRAGFLNNTTQYTAFTITPASGTLTGGTIRVYGYANS